MTHLHVRTAARIILLLSASLFSLAPAAAQSWNARCAVYRGETLLEQNDCNRIVVQSGASEDPTKESGEWVIRYEWASGGSTVTQNAEESFVINGRTGEVVGIPGTDWSICVRNSASGNTFCTKF